MKRLTTFHKALDCTGAEEEPAYQGCYGEAPNSEETILVYMNSAVQMTQALCRQTCQKRNSTYTALKVGGSSVVSLKYINFNS